VLWASPFRLEVTGLLKPKGNRLEIEVVNFWANRVLHDLSLPPEKRLTKTNVRNFSRKPPLMPSGLLGPVKVLGVKGD
jgi:hypothetical protein